MISAMERQNKDKICYDDNGEIVEFETDHCSEDGLCLTSVINAQYKDSILFNENNLQMIGSSDFGNLKKESECIQQLRSVSQVKDIVTTDAEKSTYDFTFDNFHDCIFNEIPSTSIKCKSNSDTYHTITFKEYNNYKWHKCLLDIKWK